MDGYRGGGGNVDNVVGEMDVCQGGVCTADNDRKWGRMVLTIDNSNVNIVGL